MLLRGKRLTATDLLIVDVGATAEQAGFRGALNVGGSGFRPGYYFVPTRRAVEIYYVDNRTGADLGHYQAQFVERLEPLLWNRFGRGRVRRTIYQGVRHGFEVKVK